jgi:predicted membrane-bound mannosyltransferase
VQKNKIQYLVWAVFALGAYLRCAHLGAPPLWIDEALFADWVRGVPHQEYLTVGLGKLLPDSEFYLRLPVAICGSLTVLFFYYHTGGGWKSFYGSVFVAVFPIFVFWSRVARPYAFAGLFIVLGWRWWGFYVIAILTTPVALLGLNIVRLREKRFRYIYPLMAVLAFAVYYIRPDVKKVGDFFDIPFLVNEKRIWYVPILTCLLYCCSYISDRYFSADSGEDIRSSGVVR